MRMTMAIMMTMIMMMKHCSDIGRVTRVRAGYDLVFGIVLMVRMIMMVIMMMMMMTMLMMRMTITMKVAAVCV